MLYAKHNIQIFHNAVKLHCISKNRSECWHLEISKQPLIQHVPILQCRKWIAFDSKQHALLVSMQLLGCSYTYFQFSVLLNIQCDE